VNITEPKTLKFILKLRGRHQAIRCIKSPNFPPA